MCELFTSVCRFGSRWKRGVLMLMEVERGRVVLPVQPR